MDAVHVMGKEFAQASMRFALGLRRAIGGVVSSAEVASISVGRNARESEVLAYRIVRRRSLPLIRVGSLRYLDFTGRPQWSVSYLGGCFRAIRAGPYSRMA